MTKSGKKIGSNLSQAQEQFLKQCIENNMRAIEIQNNEVTANFGSYKSNTYSAEMMPMSQEQIDQTV